MNFPSVESAIGWGVEYVTAWRNGRSFSPDADTWVRAAVRRTGGISDDACSALEIVWAMERVCSKARCPLFNGNGMNCLFYYLFPEPTEEKPSWTESEQNRFADCLKDLAHALKRYGIVE